LLLWAHTDKVLRVTLLVVLGTNHEPVPSTTQLGPLELETANIANRVPISKFKEVLISERE
jgi:hypothetical protein